MDEDKYKGLLNTLSFFIDNSIPIELISEQINPNFIDNDGYNYLHYLTNYSFKEYLQYNCKFSKNELINKEKYLSLLNQYSKIISSYVVILNEIKCNFLLVNNFGEIPFELCLIKQNYLLAMEYIKYQNTISYLFNNNNFNTINTLFSFDNFMNQECLNFLLYLFNSEEIKKEKAAIQNYLSMNINGKYTPLISILRSYNKGIYNKFYNFIKINLIDYLNIEEKKIIISDEETKNKIIKTSILNLNEFFNSFYKLINIFISLGVDLNNSKHYTKNRISLLMYIMAYPVLSNLSDFIFTNNIDVNYQDYLGKTPLIHLINNKKNIFNIDGNVYKNAFHTLINYKSIDITKKDINGFSAFLLCLVNDYYEEAIEIYNIHFNRILEEFNSDILILFIIKLFQNKFNLDFISNLSIFNKTIIDLNCIDNVNNRTLLHYFFMFYSDTFENFIDIFNKIIKLKININKKDIYKRNCLFYLFIDYCGDPKKIEDPFQKLDYCLKNNLFEINLDEKDIFENTLLFYSIKGGFTKSIEILIKYGAKITNSINYEGNTIYSTALIVNDRIFNYLYNLEKNPTIFEQKICKIYQNYESFLNFQNKRKKDDKKLNLNEYKQNNNSNNLLSLYDFFNNDQLILYDEEKIKYGKQNDKKEEDYLEEYEFEDYILENDSQNNFSLISLLSKENNDIINNYMNEFINLKFENPLKRINILINNRNIYDIKQILEQPNKFCDSIMAQKKVIISDNLDSYCSNFKNMDIKSLCEEIKENNIMISRCNDLLESNNYINLIIQLNQIIKENKDEKLINLKNNEKQNIFHILARFIYESKEMDKIYEKLNNYKIDNLFDIKGNAPMYYACNKLNKKFIEIYSKFNFTEEINKKINYSLFIETKNNSTPLEELYKHINLEDDNLLKLIIELTINLKKGYIIYILKFLINKYNSSFKNLLNQSYQTNLSNNKYINKIIGLYQYLVNDLQYNLMINKDEENDPFFLSINKKNYEFLNEVLLFEQNKKNIIENNINKEGKSLVHIIVETKQIQNKKDILKKILNKGFCFNIKDNKGFFPIDYAYFYNDKEIIDILKNKYYKEGLPLKINLKYNFNKDSDILYQESIYDSSKYQKSDDLYALVYEKFKYYGDKIHKVCVDNESIPYNAYLIRGNILYFSALINKFIIQILENTNTKAYIVITLEKEVIFNEYKYDNLNEAEMKFKELFKIKTNNDWDIVKKDKTKFKTNYKKYYFFNYDFEQENDIYDYLKASINTLYIKKNIIYNENYKIRDFIYHLTIKAYQNRFVNEENSSKIMNENIEDHTRTIIKNYKEKGLHDSIFILYKIEELLKNPNKNNIEIEKKKISYLINSYQELIPFSIHKMDTNILKSPEDINIEMGRITTYYFFENILKIFLGAIKNLDEIHPLDYIINSLGCNIIELEENSEESDYLINFLEKGGATKIINIFKIEQSINDVNFNPNNFEKRYIFCHGTKVENILGILSQGLKISPVQADFTGKAHGEGIYLSDDFSCSRFYAKKNNSKNSYMLLVEAALGVGKKDYITISTNLDFNDVFTTKDGYGIFKFTRSRPMKGIIVIKEEMNVRVKYIIEFED